MTPGLRRRPRHLEDAEAMALMAWAERRFDQETGKPIACYLLHIPNGGKRNVREAGRLKRMGVRAGVPDYFLHLPRKVMGRQFAGMWIELKAPRTTLGRKAQTTDLQDQQLALMTACGYRTLVAYGWIEAAVRISEYLGLDARGLQPCTSGR